jgi:hypothetical protein
VYTCGGLILNVCAAGFHCVVFGDFMYIPINSSIRVHTTSSYVIIRSQQLALVTSSAYSKVVEQHIVPNVLKLLPYLPLWCRFDELVYMYQSEKNHNVCYIYIVFKCLCNAPANPPSASMTSLVTAALP